MNVPATIICLHASGGSGLQWAALRARLDPGHTVLAPDFHGHGAGPEWTGLDDEIVAADSARISRLIAAAPGDVHLVGHGYGGAIALRLALCHRSSVVSVSVYDPAALRIVLEDPRSTEAAFELTTFAGGLRDALDANDLPAAAQRFVQYWGGRRAWEELTVAQQAGVMRRTRLALAQLGALKHDSPQLAEYRTLRVPVLLLHGSAMPAPVRRASELLRSVLPNASYATIPGLGHMGPVTHPGIVAQRFAEFIGDHAMAPRRLAYRVAY